MAVIDSFKANTTSVEFSWPADVTGSNGLCSLLMVICNACLAHFLPTRLISSLFMPTRRLVHIPLSRGAHNAATRSPSSVRREDCLRRHEQRYHHVATLRATLPR
ncbi:hypothetical protein BGW80DRAFT_1511429 [Lactifluus volemus]|nr:hypothetical protein BGW80DRAFT_1511429 [Lactifluus volemus]